MDLRFAVDIPPENYYQESLSNGTTYSVRHVTWAFCAKVDELQAFVLNESTKFAASVYSSWATNPPRYGTVNQSSLRVYGTGGHDDYEIPADDDDSSIVVVENTTKCMLPTGEPGFAVVDFVVLNMTMTDGQYKYSSKMHMPIQVGFMPTCEGDTCLLGGRVCIGAPGRKNCAKCIKTPQEMKNHNLKVWASYYGTDRNNRRFMSGSSNPLNFQKFSSNSVFDKLTDEMDNIGV